MPTYQNIFFSVSLSTYQKLAYTPQLFSRTVQELSNKKIIIYDDYLLYKSMGSPFKLNSFSGSSIDELRLLFLSSEVPVSKQSDSDASWLLTTLKDS